MTTPRVAAERRHWADRFGWKTFLVLGVLMLVPVALGAAEGAGLVGSLMMMFSPIALLFEAGARFAGGTGLIGGRPRPDHMKSTNLSGVVVVACVLTLVTLVVLMTLT